MEYLETLAQLLAAFGALWAVNTLMSVRNNLSRGLAWDTKYFFTGVFKAATLAVAMFVGGFVLIQLPALMSRSGIQLTDEMQAAISILGVFGAVGAGIVIQAKKFVSNVSSTFNSDGIALEVKPEKDKWNDGVIVFDPKKQKQPGDDYIESKIASEKKEPTDEPGGIGAHYNINITSYDTLRNQVLGNGYDVDGFYGWQCWDGAALLWQQLGRRLETGNGLAIGCWDLKREQNKGSEFDLIYDVNALKRGDVVCMRPNHIGKLL